jgi:hypothetical protein
MARVLIVVAKAAVPGQTKTRLCPPFSPEEAAELYRCLLADTLTRVAELEATGLTVAFAPASAEDHFRNLVPPSFRLVAQQGADLGERLSNALAHHLDAGYERAVIMNSDGPTLPLTCLEEAFSELDRADVTLGPSHDGGYYLIGMKRPHPALFQGIEWSTERVTAQTLAVSQALGLRTHLLPEWYDVDVERDLDRLWKDVGLDPLCAPCTAAFLRQRWPKGQA